MILAIKIGDNLPEGSIMKKYPDLSAPEAIAKFKEEVLIGKKKLTKRQADAAYKQTAAACWKDGEVIGIVSDEHTFSDHERKHILLVKVNGEPDSSLCGRKEALNIETGKQDIISRSVRRYEYWDNVSAEDLEKIRDKTQISQPVTTPINATDLTVV